MPDKSPSWRLETRREATAEERTALRPWVRPGIGQLWAPGVAVCGGGTQKVPQATRWVQLLQALGDAGAGWTRASSKWLELVDLDGGEVEAHQILLSG